MPEEQDLRSAATPQADDELQAINAVVAALKPLQEDERRRVLEYVLGRFGAIPLQSSLTSTATPTPVSTISSSPVPGAIHDVRSLKEAKNPRSANEMAALVAFYVSELAPQDERKSTITKADIDRYFKSASFHLPADAAFTLVNAKNAGYLDNAGPGQYKLNPVGYNLVAHRMGTREKKEPRRAREKKAARGASKETPGSRR